MVYVRPSGNVFDEMGQLWAEISDENQTHRQIQFLRTLLSTRGRILDVACGAGRHTIALSEGGFEVVGLDISMNLLRIAKKRGAQILVRGDLRFLPFKADAFDAVVSIDNSFGYLPSRKEDQQSVVEVRSVLRKGGLFLLDLFNRERLIEKYSGNATPKLYGYPHFELRQERTVSANGEWLCDHWMVTDCAGRIRVFEHKAHLYSRYQLEDMLNKARFADTEVYGDYEQQPFNAESKRLITLSTAK